MSLILNELKIANSLSILGTMTTLGTAEGIRMANDAGFISFYNTANTARTGYVQGLYGTALRIGTDGSTEMQFYIGGSQQMVINTSGNVGIGVTSPTAKLQLSGSANSLIFDAHSSAFAGRYALLPGRFSVGTLNNGYPEIGYNFSPADGVYTKIANDTAWRIGFGNSNLMQFSYAATGTGTFSWTNAMAINMSGNVGIGTTSPNATLQIAGTSTGILTVGTLTNDWGGVVAIGTTNGNGIILSKVNTANDSNRVLTLMRDDTNGATIAGYKSGGTSSDVGYLIRANASSYFNGGDVGIGTSTPLTKLNLSGGNGAVYQTFTDTTNAYHHGYIGKNGGGLVFGFSSQNGSFSADEKMRITADGNVGIGTTTPTAKLDINGSLKVKNIKTYAWTSLSANTTQARRYEIARLGHDVANWDLGGIFEIELYSYYYMRSVKKRYAVSYGYPGAGTLSLVEYQGTGDNNFQVTLGTEVVVSGNDKYLPVYTDVRYYAMVDVKVTTNWQITSSSTPAKGYCYISESPSPSNISDFTADSTIEIGSSNGKLYFGGSVGIGGTSVSDKLDISGTTAALPGRIMFGDGGGYTPYMRFYKWTGASTNYYQTTIANSITAEGALEFYTGGGGAAIGSDTQSLRMIILQGGNVGIGATSPSEKLHVNGGNAYIAYSTDTATYSSTAFNSSPRLALLCKSTTSAYNFIRFTAGGSHEWAVGTVHKSTGVADYIFQSYDGSAYGERLRILANGNVGIGTTAPAYKLHVTDGNNSIAYFGPNASWSSYLAVGAGDNKIANGTAQVISTNGNLHLDSGAAQNTYINYYSQTGTFINVNAGNVGIGTESPTAKLDVNGDVKISRAITMHSEAQDIDSRFYGGTFIRGWQSFTAGSESSITYTTDTTSPVGIEVLSVSTYVWARGPKIRLDKTQNYEVEMWVKRQTANTAGTFYFVVSNYDSSGNIISGDGNDWHYPTSINPLSATWTKYRFVVGPYGGSKDHSSSARYISVGFIANYTTGTDVIYLTGFKCRPIPRYNNDPLTIYNNGSVGIGTTSPTAKLDVNGDVKITGSLLVTGSMTIAGDLIPAADRMYSLGSSTRRWNDLYVISSSISQITESLMTISNEYTLAVVNGNRVAGFKIAINNQTSSFVIQADKFAVVNTSGVNPISPFIIENNIVYINSASIKNLTADNIAANTITADRIKANTITANEISASSITADRIRANTITANEISASAITTDKLAANSITTDKLQANSITATQISASAITTDKLAANSITATKISASAIITTHLSASIIDADKIQSNAIITTHLSASAITTAKIAADAITATQISASAITTSKIAADAIVSSHISASAITSAKIAADAITSTQISASAITSAKIAADAVTATQISASAITSAKIAADAVTATQISASAITSAKIAADAITSTQISASAIIASKIATDAITSTHISASAITSAKIAADAVTATQISASAITTAKIAADAVTATQISASAITTAKIAADAIVSSHISASAITSTKIAADAVTATQISASAITSAKIATDAITATHISASVITTSKIAADAITSTQISASAIIASKIATDAITSTHISASAITTNKLDANAVTAAKIAAGTITATEISASAITGDRIAANTITATQISASAITTDKLNANAVTAAKIAAGTITANEISASAITTNLIAAGAITAAKIAAGTITANEISASAITSAKIAAGAITADMITTGTMNAARIGVGTLTGITISGNTISGNTITGGSLNIGSGVFQVASSGNITSTGGTIGGWTIAATTLTGGSTTLNSNGTITCADLQASTAGKIGNWTIGATTLTGGSTTLNSNGTITCANLIASTAGTIGGWTIGASTLTGGNVTISSSGNIYAGQTAYDTGTGWYLENSGKFSVGNSGGNKLVWDGTKLKVTGGIYITDAIGIRNDGSSTLTITGGPSNASGGQLDLTPSGIVSLVATGGQFIQFYAGGAQRGYVQPSGLFDWLGTGEFDGSVTFQSGLTSNANVVVNGITLTYSSSEISAAAFNSTSSRRYKKNIVKFKSGLSIVEKLRPVTFDWKNKNVKNEIGLIAEEVNKVLPNIVHKNEKGKIESLDYSKLTPILLAAIKELTAEIKELKSRINKLETK